VSKQDCPDSHTDQKHGDDHQTDHAALPWGSGLNPHSCLAKSSWSRWFSLKCHTNRAGTDRLSASTSRDRKPGSSIRRTGGESQHQVLCCQGARYHHAPAHQTGALVSSTHWFSTSRLCLHLPIAFPLPLHAIGSTRCSSRATSSGRRGELIPIRNYKVHLFTEAGFAVDALLRTYVRLSRPEATVLVQDD